MKEPLSSSSAPSWRNIRSKSSGALLQECSSAAPPTYHSELDQLQEEVQRRTREEQQKKQREEELSFNPQPSKFLDLDQLQVQGV